MAHDKIFMGIVIILIAIVAGTSILNYNLLNDSANRISALEASNQRLEERLQLLATLTGYGEELNQSYLMDLALNATEEKELVIYTGHAAELMNDIIALFEKRYPFLTVRYERRNSVALQEKFRSEAAVGRWDADLILLEDYLLSPLISEGLTQPYIPQRSSKEFFNESVSFSPDGNWTIACSTGRGLTVNYEAFPNTTLWPAKYTDFINPRPEWNGKVCMIDPRLAATPYTVFWSIYHVYGLDTLQQVVEGLKACNVAVFDSPAVARGKVASGEYPIGFADNTYGARFYIKLYSAPMTFYPSADFYPVDYKWLVIPKELPHPNAAKLFIEWSLTNEAVQLYSDWGFRTSYYNGTLKPSGYETWPDVPVLAIDQLDQAAQKAFLCDKIDEWLGRA